MAKSIPMSTLLAAVKKQGGWVIIRVITTKQHLHPTSTPQILHVGRARLRYYKLGGLRSRLLHVASNLRNRAHTHYIVLYDAGQSVLRMCVILRHYSFLSRFFSVFLLKTCTYI